MKMMIGIKEEWEGEQTLWFDLGEPQKFADYVRHNLEQGDEYKFEIKEMSEEEAAKLE